MGLLMIIGAILLQGLLVWGVWNIFIAWLGMSVIFGLTPFYLSFWQGLLLGVVISVVKVVFFGGGSRD